MRIETDRIVELEYRMLDEDGELIESSADEGPMLYTHGAGEIPPKLEEALAGAERGARLEVTLEPEDAFGPYDPEGIVTVPRADFPPDHDLEPGEWIEIHVAHEHGEDEECDGDHDEEGDLQARVVELDKDSVVLDTNHPLAGRRLTFQVEVVSVRPT